MSETPDRGRDDTDLRRNGVALNVSNARAWFVREVLPLEAALMQFLRRNLRNKSDVDDVCQDVYVHVLEAARREIPTHAQRFVFTTARHLLIDRVRRESVVPIDAVADVDAIEAMADEPSAERTVIAREDLHRFQKALEALSPRVREAVTLRKIEGHSRAEIAARMNITESTVNRHLEDGMVRLADLLLSDPSELRSKG